MTNVTVIGKNSNLASFLAQRPETQDWLFLSHDEVSTREAEIRSSDVVINFAMHPDAMFKGIVTPETDLDTRLADMLADTPAHLIVASSRKVYGENPTPSEITADSPLNPEEAYGRAKKQIEENVRAAMPEDQLTILRMTNIVGWNGKDLSQKGFAGYVFNQLCKNEGVVELDYDPDCLRDFLPQEKFCEVMIAMSENPLKGTYNFGSSAPLRMGELINAWTRGYGGLISVLECDKQADCYMRSEQIYTETGISPFSQAGVIASLEDQGRALRNLDTGRSPDYDELEVWGIQ